MQTEQHSAQAHISGGGAMYARGVGHKVLHSEALASTRRVDFARLGSGGMCGKGFVKVCSLLILNNNFRRNASPGPLVCHARKVATQNARTVTSITARYTT
jgi:hypothetical protein